MLVLCICVYTIQLITIQIFLVLSALALQLVRQTYSIDFVTLSDPQSSRSPSFIISVVNSPYKRRAHIVYSVHQKRLVNYQTFFISSPFGLCWRIILLFVFSLIPFSFEWYTCHIFVTIIAIFNYVILERLYTMKQLIA